MALPYPEQSPETPSAQRPLVRASEPPLLRLFREHLEGIADTALVMASEALPLDQVALPAPPGLAELEAQGQRLHEALSQLTAEQVPAVLDALNGAWEEMSTQIGEVAQGGLEGLSRLPVEDALQGVQQISEALAHLPMDQAVEVAGHLAGAVVEAISNSG